MVKFFAELRRRNVVRVTVGYLVVAWLLIQVADVVGPALGLPDSTLRYLIIALGIGLPIAILLSWFFQLTETGLEKDTGSTSQTISDSKGRVIDFIIIGMLVAALVVSLTFHRDSPELDLENPDGRVIAVLPLNSFGADNDDGFAAGLHDDLLTTLSRIGALQVISRTSVMKFAGTELSIIEIGKQLGANAVLEGSVRRSGDAIRVNVQLVDARTDEHIWADSFDVELNTRSIFEVQSEITKAIADALQAKLTGAEQTVVERVPTDNYQAYQLYHLGRKHISRRTSADIDQAVINLREVIRLDPNYAAAYASLAFAYILQNQYSGWSVDQMLDKAMPMVQKAIELDPGHDQGHAFLGYLRDVSGDRAGAKDAYEKALSLNPRNPTTLQHYASYFIDSGDEEQAIAHFRRALKIDPLSVPISNTLAEALQTFGQPEEALQQYKYTLQLDAQSAQTFAHVGNLCRAAFGRSDRAAYWVRKAVAIDPRQPNYAALLAESYLELNDLENAKKWAQVSFGLSQRNYWPARAMRQVAEVEQNSDDLIRFGQIMLDRFSQSSIALSGIRNGLILDGEFKAAREKYYEIQPELFRAPPEVSVSNLHNSVDLAAILILLDEKEHAEKLLLGALDIMSDRYRTGDGGIQIKDVEAYALLGEREKALDKLEQALEENWFLFWFQVESNPNLKNLHTEPRYQSALKQLRDKAERLRANFAGFPDDARGPIAPELLANPC